VAARNYVEDSLTYPEWDELADQLVDTATMAPRIDDISNRGSATVIHYGTNRFSYTTCYRVSSTHRLATMHTLQTEDRRTQHLISIPVQNFKHFDI